MTKTRRWTATAQAPGVQLRFLQKPDKDSTPLRDGSVDIARGVVTAQRHAGCDHIGVSRRSLERGPIDEAAVDGPRTAGCANASGARSSDDGADAGQRGPRVVPVRRMTDARGHAGDGAAGRSGWRSASRAAKMDPGTIPVPEA